MCAEGDLFAEERWRAGDAGRESAAKVSEPTLIKPLDFWGPDLVRGILDNLYDGVYMADASRRIHYWNRGAERITGFSAGEVIGRHCWDNLLQHVDERGTSLCRSDCALSRTICQGCPQEMEAYLYHKMGHRVPVRIRVSPIRDAAGAVTGAVEVFTDNFTTERARDRIGELERMAYLDCLTGIANRRFAEVGLSVALSELERYGWSFGVVLMDIDRFKEFNDGHGHALGDRVLQTVAATLAGNSRPSDVVSRWGGDEFLSIVKNVTQGQLDAIVSKYQSLVAASYCPSDGEEMLRVTLSAGATLADLRDTPGTLLARADELMYRNKGRRAPGSAGSRIPFGGRCP